MKLVAIYIYTTILVLIPAELCFANQINIRNISLEGKINGIFIKIELDQTIDPEHIAAWTSGEEWFYITLYQVQADSSQLYLVDLPRNIRKIQPVSSSESTQLGFHLRKSIEHYEIIQDKKSNTIIASLHFPNNTLAVLNSLYNNEATKNDPGITQGLRSWMYTTGFMLSMNGLLTQGQEKTNWQTTVGLSTLIITFITDKLWTN